MSFLDTITHDASIEGEKDNLGGRSLFETDIYKFKINYAFLTAAASGAWALNLHMETPEGKDYRTAMYITSGTAKGGKNTYKDKDGNDKYLPGYLMANSLSELTTGKDFVTMAKETTEKKIVKLYNYDAKAEVNTEVDMLMGLVGQEIYAGIFKQLEDKSEKDADGVYQPTGETRDTNEIDKFFCANPKFDKYTSTEIRGKAEKAEFYEAWLTKNKGQVKDKTSKKGGAVVKPRAGAAATSAANTKPKAGLFD